MFQKFIKNLAKYFFLPRKRCQFADQNCQGEVINYQLETLTGGKKIRAWTACSAHQQAISQQFAQRGHPLIEETKNHDPKK